ncbi:MAG: hypothetical protein ACTSQO_14900 [Candidatus Helarchaeota archaeon]
MVSNENKKSNEIKKNKSEGVYELKSKEENEFEDNAVANMISGGTSVMIAGLIAGLFGWIATVFVSRPDIGIGASGYALLSTANSMIIIISSLSGGINQSISKYIAESYVESKETALEYARASSLSMNIFGISILSIFMVISFLSFKFLTYIYGIIFLFAGLAIFFSFFRDNLIGNIGGFQKFKTIAIINFTGIIGGVTLTLSIFYVPPPYNQITFLAQVFAVPLIQIIFALIFARRIFPYNVFSIYKLPSSWKFPVKISKYGFYCTVPQVILNQSIFWIQIMYYQMFFGPNDPIVGIAGILLGYSGVMGAINMYGWPQIPAVSEAKARNNQDLIDKLVGQCFKTGFNISIMFLVFYIGLAHPILELFHTAQYLPGYVPFILLAISATMIGIVFIIASMMVGLGRAKVAFIYILIIIISAFVLTPGLIILFSLYTNKYMVLFAGPLGLLIPTIFVLPFLFKSLPKYTTKPSKYYLFILLKGSVSVAVANITSYFIENFVYPYNTFLNGIPTGFLVGIGINTGIFIFLICFLSALDDQDWDLFKKFLGPLKFLTLAPEWLSKNSPFHHKNNSLD